MQSENPRLKVSVCLLYAGRALTRLLLHLYARRLRRLSLELLIRLALLPSAAHHGNRRTNGRICECLRYEGSP